MLSLTFTLAKPTSMKTLLTSIIILAALATKASTNNVSTENDGLFQTSRAYGCTPKPNGRAKGTFALSSSGVEVAKSGNPFQLFNPFAPAKYESAEENVVHDSSTGKVTGLKLFSLSF
jgi:hypothetical protein